MLSPILSAAGLDDFAAHRRGASCLAGCLLVFVGECDQIIVASLILSGMSSCSRVGIFEK